MKGFAQPIRTYKVVGIYEDLEKEGRILRKEEDGVRVVIDLSKQDKADAIEALKDVISRLED